MSSTSSTRPEPTSGAPLWRSAVPVFGVLAGVAFWLAAWAGGHPAIGAGMFALMLAVSVAAVLGARRSEVVRGLLDRRDERITAIDVRATAVSGVAVILAILIAFVVQVARGQTGSPYTWLAAVAGGSYLLAVVVLSARR